MSGMIRGLQFWKWCVYTLISLSTVYVILDWYFPKEMRTLDNVVKSHSEVTAFKYTYYEGSSLSLSVWLVNGGYLFFSSVAVGPFDEGLEKGAIKPTLRKIGPFRVTCERVVSNDFGQEHFGDSANLMLPEIGIDPYSFTELVASYSQALTYAENLPLYAAEYTRKNQEVNKKSDRLSCRKSVEHVPELPSLKQGWSDVNGWRVFVRENTN